MKIATWAAIPAACLMMATAAQAQGYVGLAGGPTKISDDCSGTTSCDTTGTGFKIYGGYKFASNFAGELVYMNFGKASFASGSVTGELKPTALGLGVAYIADVAPNVPFAARVGIARAKASVSGRVGSVAVNDSENSTTVYAGLSIGYAFSPSVAATLSYDGSRAKYGGGTDPVSLFSVGLNVSF